MPRVYQRGAVVTNNADRPDGEAMFFRRRPVSLRGGPEHRRPRAKLGRSRGKGGAVKLDSLYPVLLTDDVAESSRFFVEHLGFRRTFESDWYVSLVHGGNEAYELAVIACDHGTVPEGFRRPTGALLLNFEVPDVRSEYERLRSEGLEILQPIQDLAAGQRHFICRAPGDVMVDVIEVVPPSEEYADQYVS